MKITLEVKPFADLEVDALATYVFEDDEPVQGRLAEIDKLTGGLLGRLSKSGELTGKPLEITLLHAPTGLKSARLLLIGAGKREQFNPAMQRKVAGVALRNLKSRNVHKVAFLVRESDATEELAQAAAEGRPLLPDSILKIRDQSEARKRQQARKLLEDFLAPEGKKGGR